MIETKWTPGPWTWVGGTYGHIANADGKPLVLHGRSHEAAANRNLASAAPELYAALERATVLLKAAGAVIGDDGDGMDFTHVDNMPTDNVGFSIDCENAVDRASVALAKARGESC